jgi:hypothetical protein
VNYAGIQAAVAAYSHRDDLTALMPTFVELAETRLNRSLRIAEMEKTATTSAVSEFTQLPLDFQSVRYVTSGGRPLQYQMPERMAQQVAEGWVPNPGIYTIQDMQIRLLPAPSVAAPIALQIVYYADIPSLVANGSNWLADAYPDVYVSAMMVEVCTYTKDPESAVWERRLEDRLLAMRAQSQQMLFGGAIAIKAG